MNDPISQQLAALPAAQAEVLRRYWARAKELVPEAAAATYYGMPALKHLGAGLVSLMPTKRGFSVYPYGSAPVAEFIGEHPEYEHTKGSIHFTAAEPLPIDHFDEIVAIRLRLIEDRVNR